MTAITAEEGSATRTASPLRRIALMLALPLLIVAAGLLYWVAHQGTESTDNAQVGAHVVSIAPEVAGRVIEVFTAENRPVKRGDLLFRIDPEPYRIALMQADAAVGNARIQIDQLSNDYTARVADIDTKASDVRLAQENFARQRDLLARGFTTRANYDAARAALASAMAERNSAAAEAASARATLGSSPKGGHPQIEAAIAQRDKAALDLARTEVRAPIAGIASQTDRLQPGAMAMTMMGMMSIVSDGDYWIEANFKETQLDRMRVGQRAEVEVDAIPGRTFKGRVASIGAGTGSQFSIIPAQNATGNWVKVTQRVPVRIALDERPKQPLVSGWSAHVTVHVGD